MIGIRITVLLILVVSFSSCIKEKFDPAKFDLSQNIEPGLAVPVGYSKLEMGKYLADAIANNQLLVADDGLLSLFYSDSVSSGTLGDLLTFPALGINKEITNETGFPINLPAGLPSLEFMDSVFIPVSLEQSGARLDSILLLSGSLEANPGISFLNGTISYEFPGLQKNSQPFNQTMDINGQGLNIDLAGYTLIPELNGGFKCIFSVVVESTSAPIPVDSNILNIQTNLNDLMFETIYGDLSGFEIPIPPIQLAPGAFTQIVDGEFGFADPKIQLFFSNSIGVPAGLFFSQLEAVMRDNSIISLEAEDIPTPPADPRIIRYPGLEEMGQIINDTLHIKKENSNLPEFFSSNVNLINITPTPRIGPPDSSEVVFIRYDSRIDLKASIEIPIWGRAEFFVLLDTISFDYLGSALPVPEELDQLIVRLNLVNSFPVSIAPQVYMLDENKILLDSIITDNQKIEGALDTDQDGRVNPLPSMIDIILLDKETKENLVKTRYLVTQGRITTTPPAEDVKFYLSYFLQYKIGLIAQLKINTGK